MTGQRVMIVEDDLFSAKLLQKSLEELGHTIVANVGSSQKALAAYQENRPEIVLLDFQLQEAIDGSDLAEKLKEIEATSIVFITSSNDESSLQKILASKPDGYIQKPLDIRQLRSVLDMVAYKREKETEMQALLKNVDEQVIEMKAAIDTIKSSTQALNSLISNNELEKIDQEHTSRIENASDILSNALQKIRTQ